MIKANFSTYNILTPHSGCTTPTRRGNYKTMNVKFDFGIQPYFNI